VIYGVIEETDESSIKIGYAQSPGEAVDIAAAVRRVNQYQTGNRRDLYVVCAAAGGRNDEAALHRRFEQQWVAGEWFLVSGAVIAWIEATRIARPARVRKQRTASLVTPVVMAVPQRAVSTRSACLGCTRLIEACQCASARPVDLAPGEWIWKGTVRGSGARNVNVQAPAPIKRVRCRLCKQDGHETKKCTVRAVNVGAAQQSPYEVASSRTRRLRCAWPKVCTCSACVRRRVTAMRVA
jgi:hypothetical protein